MQAERAELYFRQGSSDKVYHLQLQNGDPGKVERCDSLQAGNKRETRKKGAIFDSTCY
jgi:hypothetical protein